MKTQNAFDQFHKRKCGSKKEDRCCILLFGSHSQFSFHLATLPMLRFSKVLVANRGEIASRIIRTTKNMGIKSIALCNDIDKNSSYIKEVSNRSEWLYDRQMKRFLFLEPRTFFSISIRLSVLQRSITQM